MKKKKELLSKKINKKRRKLFLTLKKTQIMEYEFTVKEVVARGFFDINQIRIFTGFSRFSYAVIDLIEEKTSQNREDFFTYIPSNGTSGVLNMEEFDKGMTNVSAICYTGKDFSHRQIHSPTEIEDPRTQAISGMGLVSGRVFPGQMKIKLWSTADAYLDKFKGTTGEAPPETEENDGNYVILNFMANETSDSIPVTSTYDERKRLHEYVTDQFKKPYEELKKEGKTPHECQGTSIVWACNYIGHHMIGPIDSTFATDTSQQRMSWKYACQLMFIAIFVTTGVNPRTIDLESVIERVLENEGATFSWLCNLISFLSHACPYHADLRKHPTHAIHEMLTVEAIGHPWECDCGDCEDMAWGMMAIFHMFKDGNGFSGLSDTGILFKKLARRAKELLSKMEFGGLLCSLRRIDKPGVYQGHASGILMTENLELITIIDSVDIIINFYGPQKDSLIKKCREVLSEYRKLAVFPELKPHQSPRKSDPYSIGSPNNQDDYVCRIHPIRIYTKDPGSYVATDEENGTIACCTTDKITWRKFEPTTIPPEIALSTTVGISGKYPIVHLGLDEKDCELDISSVEDFGPVPLDDVPLEERQPIYKVQVNGDDSTVNKVFETLMGMKIIGSYRKIRMNLGYHVCDLCILIAFL